jgi:nicotinamide mononucleotide transporter
MSGLFGWANAAIFTVGSESVKWSDLVGNICGLSTVGLAVRRSIWTWPVQIVSCVLLFGASMSAHLGGNASRQVVLGAAACYGWYRWLRGRRERGGVRVRWANGRERALLVAVLVAGTLGFAWVLATTHTSWAPLPDAYIFVGSLVATYAQARGVVEFWFTWILVDVVGVPLAVMNGLVVSGVVYGFFFALCLLGIRDWVRQARAVPAAATNKPEAVSV